MNHSVSIEERIANLSPDKRAVLEAHLTRQAAQTPIQQRIPHRTTAGPCPLSFSQQRLWFIQQLEPQRPVFHNSMAWQLTGQLDLNTLTRTLAEITSRHAILRTRILIQQGEPVQCIDPVVPFHLPYRDLRAATSDETDVLGQVQQLWHELIYRPYDFTIDYGWRFLLVQLADEQHALLIAKHHIATDGWSTGIFQREFSLLYMAYRQGEPSPLRPLPIQYADFAVWQRAQLQGTRLEAALAYWRQQLQKPPVLQLPTDYPRTATQHGVQRDAAANHEFVLAPSLTVALKALSKAQGVTLYMTLLAVFKILLFRYTGQLDLSVGAPIAGRGRPEVEGLIGFFLNTLVLRSQINPDATFLALLAEVRRTTVDAYAHQDVPIERLIEELHPDRSRTDSPLFQVLFLLQNMPRHTLALPGLRVTRLPHATEATAYDLSCTLREEGDQIIGQFTYRAALFQGATIARMVGHYQTLLASAVADPTCPLATMPMLTAAERQQLLVTWQQTNVEHKLDQSLVELFAQQVAQRPNTTAFLTDEATLTYRELSRRANQLAQSLHGAGVTKGTVVGVCLPRSFEAVVALLAIFQVGAVYLPLDPAYPQGRLAFMINDAKAAVLVTNTRLQSMLTTTTAKRICLDGEQAIAALSTKQSTDLSAFQPEPSQPDDPAYIIYTSGSTGQPKGALVPHRQILNRLWWMWRKYPCQADELSCQKTALSFVDSLWELLGPLLQGSPTVILSDEVVRDPQRLIQSLARHGVTRLWLVPTLLQLLLQELAENQSTLPRLRFLVASGEALPTALCEQVQTLLPQATLYNLYGTSEVWDATWYDPTTDGGTTPRGASIPIGKPIDNIQSYILDGQQQPVPIGVTGELYIGGSGLAAGYLNRPDLTAAKFITWGHAKPGNHTSLTWQDASTSTQRLYRTGDLARYRVDGNIEFMGRADFQVKLRGMRVELGEIEHQLLQHPAVREAVVIVHRPPDAAALGEQRLVAYLVGTAHCQPATLRQWLQTRLPAYMVPSAFRLVAKLPLTPSGKIDRSALAQQPIGETVSERYSAPADPIEIALAIIWEQLLGTTQVSRTARFFELGGHSLLALRLMAEIRRVFGIGVSLATLFADPTIVGLATYLRQQPAAADTHGAAALHSSGVLLPIRQQGTRSPFFLVAGGSGGETEFLIYAPLIYLLGEDQPVYGLQAQGLDGVTQPHLDIESMAADYVRAIRTVQPQGPYFLGGECIGGKVAFAMACQLQQAGAEVKLLVLLDTALELTQFPQTRWQFLWKQSHRRFTYHLQQVGPLPNGEKVYYLQRLANTLWSMVTPRGKQSASKRHLRQVQVNYKYLGHVYRPVQPYAGDLTLLLSEQLYTGRSAAAWQSLVTGRVEVLPVAGTHRTYLGQHLRSTAEQLQRCLQRAQLPSPRVADPEKS